MRAHSAPGGYGLRLLRARTEQSGPSGHLGPPGLLRIKGIPGILLGSSVFMISDPLHTWLFIVLKLNLPSHVPNCKIECKINRVQIFISVISLKR